MVPHRGAALTPSLFFLPLLFSPAGSLTVSRAAAAAWIAPAGAPPLNALRPAMDQSFGVAARRAGGCALGRGVRAALMHIGGINTWGGTLGAGGARCMSALAAQGDGSVVERGPPEDLHVSVLPAEVLEAFRGIKVRTFIDGTLGMGGHSLGICDAHQETLETLVGIDQDPVALQLAAQRLAAHGDKLKLVSGNFADLARLAEDAGVAKLRLVSGNFADLARLAEDAGVAKLRVVSGNFTDLARLAQDAGGTVDGILLDIGTSSLQLDEAERGFSFMRDGPLDMRMNPNGPMTAADICNNWAEEDIAQVIWEYGEERRSRVIWEYGEDRRSRVIAKKVIWEYGEERRSLVIWEYGEDRRSRVIAKKVVAQREIKPFETTHDLVKSLVIAKKVVAAREIKPFETSACVRRLVNARVTGHADAEANCPRVIGGARFGKGNHPATLTFQALRIAVNQELHVLSKALPQAAELLAPGGRLAVISFHSLEDRIVKQAFKDLTQDAGPRHKNKYARDEETAALSAETSPPLRLVHRRPVTATEAEEKVNPRARSAKLRIIERVY
ncbi:MraW methylase family-domain-containing protein [Baffinella frigidus]|nr:MraW methylase family-domain-containing protein [Cryptophyta sp. CCMP2293]